MAFFNSNWEVRRMVIKCWESLACGLIPQMQTSEWRFLLSPLSLTRFSFLPSGRRVLFISFFFSYFLFFYINCTKEWKLFDLNFFPFFLYLYYPCSLSLLLSAQFFFSLDLPHMVSFITFAVYDKDTGNARFCYCFEEISHLYPTSTTDCFSG